MSHHKRLELLKTIRDAEDSIANPAEGLDEDTIKLHARYYEHLIKAARNVLVWMD